MNKSKYLLLYFVFLLINPFFALTEEPLEGSALSASEQFPVLDLPVAWIENAFMSPKPDNKYSLIFVLTEDGRKELQKLNDKSPTETYHIGNKDNGMPNFVLNVLDEVPLIIDSQSTVYDEFKARGYVEAIQKEKAEERYKKRITNR